MDASHYFEHDRLRDGRPVIVRAIQPDDKQNLQEGLARLSTDSVYKRFFRVIGTLSERELKYFTEVDFDRHVALGVGLLVGEQVLPIAVGRYIVSNPEVNPCTAEVALVVEDEYQGVGVGSLLLRHLIRVARDGSIVRFVAFLHASNFRMYRVLLNSGLPMQGHTEDGITEVTLWLGGP
ncbi:MAG: GNAT family N-acetyltransferase [Planctomycetes bacterium]|nr:GNAT family N-acetyltransferase [Planctomycetota bacterium]